MLIGLPGAGKSTVAARAAQRLGAPWCDLDARISAAAGCSIPEIFDARGEAAFRELERRAMAVALAEAPQLIAAGGGWAAEAGNIAAARPVALVVHLAVAPGRAASRLSGAADRPLLAGDPAAMEQRLAGLLAERSRWYRLADVELVADAPLDDVVAAVVAVARREAGW